MLNKMRLLTPGPTPLPENVRLALAQDMIHHRKPGFKAILAEVQEGLQYLFGTSQTVAVMTCSGTGAMTAAVGCLFAPGEKVLVVEAGKFGERWREIAAARGLSVVVLEFPWGEAADPARVREALDRHPDAAGLLVQASETSTGALHPVREIAALTRERDTLLVVDGISAVGISPCPMDAWGLDCLLTGSQKGLMLPPGLAFAALSPRARDKAARIGPGDFYLDLPGELDKLGGNQTLYTPAVNLIVGLQASLAAFREQGLDAVFRKQWALTMLARTGVKSLGLEPLVKQGFAWGLTSVLLPAGVDGKKLTAEAADRYGVILAAGQGFLTNRIVRIGHMGHVDWADVAAGLHALAGAYRAVGGYSAASGYLEQGLRAYEEALETYPQGTQEGGQP